MENFEKSSQNKNNCPLLSEIFEHLEKIEDRKRDLTIQSQINPNIKFNFGWFTYVFLEENAGFITCDFSLSGKLYFMIFCKETINDQTYWQIIYGNQKLIDQLKNAEMDLDEKELLEYIYEVVDLYFFLSVSNNDSRFSLDIFDPSINYLFKFYHYKIDEKSKMYSDLKISSIYEIANCFPCN